MEQKLFGDKSLVNLNPDSGSMEYDIDNERRPELEHNEELDRPNRFFSTGTSLNGVLKK